MIDTPEKPVTLGLARGRYLESISNSTDDEGVDPEDAAEDLATQQEEIAEAQKQAMENRALGLTDDEREDLFAGFRQHQIIINACNFVGAFVFFFGALFAFKAMNHRLAGPSLPGQIQLFPDTIIWFFFAGFGALTFPWEITLQVWALFGDRRTVFLYRQWQKRSTFNYKGGQFKNELGLYHWFILLVALPIGVASSLALNMRSTLGPSSIDYCGYGFRPCKALPYADVKTIAYIAPNGAVKPPAHAKLVIAFSSGVTWASTDWGDANKDVDPAMVRFLAARVPRPITGIEALQEASPPANQSVPTQRSR